MDPAHMIWIISDIVIGTATFAAGHGRPGRLWSPHFISIGRHLRGHTKLPLGGSRFIHTGLSLGGSGCFLGGCWVEILATLFVKVMVPSLHQILIRSIQCPSTSLPFFFIAIFITFVGSIGGGRSMIPLGNEGGMYMPWSAGSTAGEMA